MRITRSRLPIATMAPASSSGHLKGH